MARRADIFDLSGLRLSPGEGRKLDLAVAIDPFELGGEHYQVEPVAIPARLEVSCMVGGGYVLRLRFDAALSGSCMRCLEPASLAMSVDAREISQPAEEAEELTSPYVDGSLLDLRAWARDALALGLPVQLLCREDCAGLCPECGADLNAAGAEHHHEATPDPRWAKLSELKFD